jgi:hypothetical protein
MTENVHLRYDTSSQLGVLGADDFFWMQLPSAAAVTELKGKINR